ncbi:MAG: metal ABC transporter permease [Gemmataceae bacterium]|nr:metal ABC transporter permease [Gemmataceae bacterium]
MNGVLDYNARLVLAGVSLLGASAGAIGCFAVLRRRALTGDALAHAALPGLCLAFLLWGERHLPVLLGGAACSGVAGIGVIGGLRRYTRIKEDAAIAIVLSVFTGLGTVLLSLIRQRPGGSRAGLDSFIFGKTAGMTWEDLQWIAALAGATLLVVGLAYKELKLVAFDPAFARVQGWPAFTIDFVLMLLIVVAIVIGLPAAGVLLMAALLVIPGAAARFWTDRLDRMLLAAALIGLVSGGVGAGLTIVWVKVPTGPAIILTAASIFLISLLLAPRRGVVAQRLRRRCAWQILPPPECEP